MAREVVIRMVNDFDRGTPADRVLEFAVDGYSYVVDLDVERDDAFRAFVAPYIEVAHERVKLSSGGPKPGSKTLKANDSETKEARQAIRDWANANGFKVPVRGKIQSSIRDAYLAAMTGGDQPSQPGQLRLVEDAPDTANQAAKDDPGPAVEHNPKPVDDNAPNSQGVTPDMRKWARSKGIKLNNGYLKSELRQQYLDDQQQAKTND